MLKIVDLLVSRGKSRVGRKLSGECFACYSLGDTVVMVIVSLHSWQRQLQFSIFYWRVFVVEVPHQIFR